MVGHAETRSRWGCSAPCLTTLKFAPSPPPPVHQIGHRAREHANDMDGFSPPSSVHRRWDLQIFYAGYAVEARSSRSSMPSTYSGFGGADFRSRRRSRHSDTRRRERYGGLQPHGLRYRRSAPIAGLHILDVVDSIGVRTRWRADEMDVFSSPSSVHPVSELQICDVGYAVEARSSRSLMPSTGFGTADSQSRPRSRSPGTRRREWDGVFSHPAIV